MINFSQPHRSKNDGMTLPVNSLTTNNRKVGDVVFDRYGNRFERFEYDTTETSITKSLGTPVGLKRSAPTKITASFSASGPDLFVGVLCTPPTSSGASGTAVANKYVWVLTNSGDISQSDYYDAITLTTDGLVALGDPIAWAGNNLFRSNKFGSEGGDALSGGWNAGFATAADSSTSLTAAKIGKERWTNPGSAVIARFAIDNFHALTGANLVSGGDTPTFSVVAGNTGGLKIATTTTLNQEAEIHTPSKLVKAATGKRVVARFKLAINEGNTDKASVFAGFAENLLDLMVDTTGALGAGSAIGYGAFVYKIESTLALKGGVCDGTTATTGTGASIKTITSGTEYDVRITWEGAATETVTISIDGETAVSRQQTQGTPANCYFVLNVKNTNGTNAENASIRDLVIGCEV